VVAANFQDYLWLLAGGIGPYEAVANPDLTREPNRPFMDFAKAHSSTGPVRPEEVLDRAKNAYPAFLERIESLCR
jgi:hypothetical protein